MRKFFSGDILASPKNYLQLKITPILKNSTVFSNNRPKGTKNNRYKFGGATWCYKPHPNGHPDNSYTAAEGQETLDYVFYRSVQFKNFLSLYSLSLRMFVACCQGRTWRKGPTAQLQTSTDRGSSERKVNQAMFVWRGTFLICILFVFSKTKLIP